MSELILSEFVSFQKCRIKEQTENGKGVDLEGLGFIEAECVERLGMLVWLEDSVIVPLRVAS